MIGNSDNTVYNAGEYIIRVSRKGKDNIFENEFFRLVLEYLHSNSFIVAPVRSAEGRYSYLVNGYSVSVFPYIKGAHPKPNELIALAKPLAYCMYSTHNMPIHPNPQKDTVFQRLLRQTDLESLFPKDLDKLDKAIITDAKYHKRLKLGVIHGDLHPGNIIKTSGGDQFFIIDWDDSSLSPLEKDIGIHFYYVNMILRERSNLYIKKFMKKISLLTPDLDRKAIRFYYRLRFISMFLWCSHRYKKDPPPLERQLYINFIYNELVKNGFSPNESIVDNHIEIPTNRGILMYGVE